MEGECCIPDAPWSRQLIDELSQRVSGASKAEALPRKPNLNNAAETYGKSFSELCIRSSALRVELFQTRLLLNPERAVVLDDADGVNRCLGLGVCVRYK